MNMPRQPMRVEQQEIDEAGDEIAGRIAALQEPGDGAARLRRDRSPWPGSRRGPIRRPSRCRTEASTSSAVSESAQSRRRTREPKTAMMSTISTGRRPKRSASRPKMNAPSGRIASVRNTPATRLTSVPNSLARPEHEHQQEVIERVERPAEKARPDRTPLRRLERFEIGDQAHCAAPLLALPLLPTNHSTGKAVRRGDAERHLMEQRLWSGRFGPGAKESRNENLDCSWRGRPRRHRRCLTRRRAPGLRARFHRTPYGRCVPNRDQQMRWVEGRYYAGHGYWWHNQWRHHRQRRNGVWIYL